MITKNEKGVLSVAAVAVLLAVCLSPIFIEETDAAADGTVYLRPGDTYKWDPGYNIDTSRITVTVNVSTSTTPGAYNSTSNAGGVTATVNSDKTISVAVASGTAASTVYVKVKAVVTTGVSQTINATMTVKVVNPTISYSTVNTYPGGEVSVTPTINNANFDSSKSATYAMSGYPSGLTIDPATGKITGTVSSSATAKTYTVTVVGTVKTSPTQTFSTSFDVVVANSMSLNAVSDQYTAKGTAMTVNLTGTATTSDTAWKITSGAVSGITMSTDKGASGTISVAASTAAGTYKVEYSATNPTSGQVVTGSVNINVGSVSIDKITTAGGYVDSVTQLYSKAGAAATFTVSATSTPSSLGLTLSLSGNASGITVSGQTISVDKSVAANTYKFTITETQALTGATASKTVTLIVDPEFEFQNSVTSGSLTVKGAGA